MRFRIRPLTRSTAEPNVSDPDFLCSDLANSLQDEKVGDVVFHFEDQVRPADSINPDIDIENASHRWSETILFVHVVTLTIPLKVFDTPEHRERCKRPVFTPRHGLKAHHPLGGINRLLRADYEASAIFRNLPNEPVSSEHMV